MAKHDQRILKFLAQNSDRAPTITDMMTRLNISISEISASLSSLLAQGLIAKRTNNQGIECWFPAGNGVAAAAEPVAETPALRRASSSQAIPAAAVSGEGRFSAGSSDRFRAPDPIPSVPRQEASAFSAPSPHLSAVAEMPPPSVPAQPGAMPRPINMNPPKSGIGLFTLLVCMSITIMVSTFLGNRLVERSMVKFSKGMVNQKGLEEFNNSVNMAVSKNQSQVKALEDQVRKLGAELAAMRAADSLKAVSAAKAPPPQPAVAQDDDPPVKKTRRRR